MQNVGRGYAATRFVPGSVGPRQIGPDPLAPPSIVTRAPMPSEATSRADARPDPGTGMAGAGTPGVREFVSLRPLRVTSALDLGFDLFRVQARTLIALATLLYLPIQLVDLTLRLRDNSGGQGSELVTSGIPVAAIGALSMRVVAVLAAQSVALSMIGMCCGRLTKRSIDEQVFGLEPSTPSEGLPGLLRWSLSRSWVSVCIVGIVLVVYAVLACLPVVGFVAAGASTFMASVVAGAEGLGPVAAVGRSVRLARSNTGAAVGLFLGGACLLWLARGLLIVGPIALMAVLGAPPALMSGLGNAAALMLVVVQPLTATLAAGSYVLFRTRSEGIDLIPRIDALRQGA